MRLIFVGPPASGKGTQARQVATRGGVPHVSTGDMFREAIREGTPVGRQADAVIQAGGLVSDGIVIALVEERLARADAEKGFLLDGFPRTLPQAEALERLERKIGRPLQAVLHIDVPDAVCLERITGRRSCPRDGSGYHLRFIPPKRAGTCDLCGAALVQRPDDTLEAASKRLQKYHAETAAILPYYAKRGLVRRVDGNRPPADVTAAIEKALQGIQG